VLKLADQKNLESFEMWYKRMMELNRSHEKLRSITESEGGE